MLHTQTPTYTHKRTESRRGTPAKFTVSPRTSKSWSAASRTNIHEHHALICTQIDFVTLRCSYALLTLTYEEVKRARTVAVRSPPKTRYYSEHAQYVCTETEHRNSITRREESLFSSLLLSSLPFFCFFFCLRLSIVFASLWFRSETMRFVQVR